MHKLLPLILLTGSLNSFSQDTTLNYTERISYDFTSDSTVQIDSFKVERGGYLPIKITGEKIFILGYDTLEVISSFRRLDSARIFVLQKRVIESIEEVWIEIDSVSDMIQKFDTTWQILAPITAILRENYFDIEYPKPQPYSGSRTRTVMFVLPPKPPYSD